MVEPVRGMDAQSAFRATFEAVKMKRNNLGIWGVMLGLWAGGPCVEAAHTRAELVLEATRARPGEVVWAGLHLRMDPEWHTYWRNPGASGMATKISWDLPEGISAGPIHWPPPEKYGEDDLATYVYHDEVVLLIPLRVASNQPPGRWTLKGKASWLECKEVCVPGSAEVSAVLEVGTERQASAAAGLIQQWRNRLPQDGAGLGFRAVWDAPAGRDRERPVVLEWAGPDAIGPAADFFPYEAEDFEIQAPGTRLPADPGKVRLRKVVQTFTGNWPSEIAGIVVTGQGAAVRAWEVRATVQEPAGSALGSPTSNKGPGAGPSGGLGWMLGYAFLGGLILNVMPCVLPVIALKILGFVNQAGEDRRRILRLGWVYTLGVLASFAALAGLVIGLQGAGRQAGWGIQFGNPYFLIGMTILVTLIALNLFGVFEVTLGGRTMDSAAQWASRPGAAGAFFSGLLTTVLATSCTAPFLGVAVGFAFVQPPWVVVLVLLTVGLGLAFPYLLLSWQPGWLRWLPRPGPWMEHFKVAMGFPMLGAAVWLLSLVEAHYGDRTWWLAWFLVLLGVAAWFFGTFWQRGRSRRGLGLFAALVVLVVGYVGLLEGAMHWREPAAVTTGADVSGVAAKGDAIPWQPWSPEAVAAARAAGRPVLVDFTARWCLTCQANKKFALEVPSVRAKLREVNAVALIGDYTHFPDAITQELKRFGRAGVPLVLVYPADPSREPLVLPEALTPGIVLEALEKAAR